MAASTGSQGPSRVGIVIATHDAERWIAETLRSVLAQTLADWHCVVVDDGSRDASGDVARSVLADDPRAQVLRREQGGVSAARNTGLAALPADCHYVIFLDSDDLWVPEALQVLRAALDERPDAAGVTAVAELIDEQGEAVAPGLHPAKLRERLVARHGRLLRLPAEADTTFDALVTAGRIWPPAVALLRRSVVDAVGGFDEALRISEDWDLFLRVSRCGPLRFLDRQVAWYRRRSGSLTADDAAGVVYFNDVVRAKAAAAAENTPEQRRAALRGWRTVQLHATRITTQELAAAVRAGSRSKARRAIGHGWPLLHGALSRTPPAPSPADSPGRTAMVSAVQPAPRRGLARR